MSTLGEDGWKLPGDANNLSTKFPTVVLGTDNAGNAIELNLEETGHLLVVGPIGSGKSYLLHNIVKQILTSCSPDDVRLILADLNGAEWSGLSRLPHLLTPVVMKSTKLENVFAWTNHEIDRRLEALSEIGSRDIGHFNELVSGTHFSTEHDEPIYQRMPHIVVVVDGIDEATNSDNDSARQLVARIANRGRSVGVFVIIAVHPSLGRQLHSQIGSSTRLVLRMRTSAEMRTLVDKDLIESSPEWYVAQLVEAFPNQDRLVHLQEMDFDAERLLVEHWRVQAPEAVFVQSLGTTSGLSNSDSQLQSQNDDELIRQAIEIVVRSGIGSPSLLQRKLKIGFARAGRLMDELEERGIVGPSEGPKARSVLMSPQELDYS